MNRILKFRAWDAKNNKWLLGYELPKLGGFSMIGEMMLFGEYTAMLNSFNLDDLDCIKLMQFTGLTNNDGKEIYEGDIVQYGIDNLNMQGVVKFRTEHNPLGWYVDTDTNELGLYTHMKLLGNIYENPELIQKQ